MIEIFDISYFKLARNVARNSVYRIKVGAVLVNKKPIVLGWNKLKTHPRFANPESRIKLSIHAEIDCLKKVKFKSVIGTAIYVYREDGNGRPAMSRPCNDCITELKMAGIKRIYYSTSEYPYWKSEVL